MNCWILLSYQRIRRQKPSLKENVGKTSKWQSLLILSVILDKMNEWIERSYSVQSCCASPHELNSQLLCWTWKIKWVKLLWSLISETEILHGLWGQGSEELWTFLVGGYVHRRNTEKNNNMIRNVHVNDVKITALKPNVVLKSITRLG